jgi:hypothetical protein
MYYHAPIAEGYTYECDVYCPECPVEYMISEGTASPAAHDMGAEGLLDQLAAERGIECDAESVIHSMTVNSPKSSGRVRLTGRALAIAGVWTAADSAANHSAGLSATASPLASKT